MSHPRIKADTRSGPLWRLLSGLLLFGLIGWTSTTSGTADQPSASLLMDRAGPPVLAGGPPESLRPRSTVRSDCILPGNGDGSADDPFHGHTALALLPETLPVRSSFSLHLPDSAPYARPVPRAPPTPDPLSHPHCL